MPRRFWAKLLLSLVLSPVRRGSTFRHLFVSGQPSPESVNDRFEVAVFQRRIPWIAGAPRRNWQDHFL
jgi:hypothetical protein